MGYYYCIKVIFVAKDVSRMVFEGSFFDGAQNIWGGKQNIWGGTQNIWGGAQNIWGHPYLNSTTILFDSETRECVDKLLS